MKRLLLPIAPAIPFIFCAVACSIVAIVLALLTYALGWHDNEQLASLFEFGFFAGSYTGYVLVTKEPS